LQWFQTLKYSSSKISFAKIGRTLLRVVDKNDPEMIRRNLFIFMLFHGRQPTLEVFLTFQKQYRSVLISSSVERARRGQAWPVVTMGGTIKTRRGPGGRGCKGGEHCLHASSKCTRGSAQENTRGQDLNITF